MKKIYCFVFTLAALLAFASIATAQTSFGEWSIKGVIQDKVYPHSEDDPGIINFPKDNGLQEATDFAYSKNVSAPFGDGTYWIKLESYATGSAATIEVDAPVDIALVLDVSTSMSRINIEAESSPNTASVSLSYNDVVAAANRGEEYFVLCSNGYWNRIVAETRNNRYYLYVYPDGNGKRYLSNGNNGRYQIGNGGSVPNNGPQSADTDIATFPAGDLKTGTSRILELQKAVKALINEIDENDAFIVVRNDAGQVTSKTPRANRLGNRISIITFATNATEVAGLTPVENNVASLNTLVDGFVMSSGTYGARGVNIANNQLQGVYQNERVRYNNSSRTVVFFTDGEQADNSNHRGFNAVIGATHTSKDTYGATVFTVGLFDSAQPEATTDIGKGMSYTSSNYPDATNTTNHGTKKSDSFYFDTSTGDVSLVDAFTQIAQQSGGSTSSLSAASSNVDVVSNSFVLPDGVDADNIDEHVLLFFAKVDNQHSSESELVFFEERLQGHLPAEWTFLPLDEDGVPIQPEVPQKPDAGVSVSLYGEKGILVTGFDYSGCFCGPVTDENNVTTYQGYKLIIMIPIQANPDAVGGPNVETNAPGSGIYVSNPDTGEKAYVDYKSPTVSLPYNFFLQKEGLQPGESAKFKLERAYIPKDAGEKWSAASLDENEWMYVSTVFVTQPMGAAATDEPVVKIYGLPSTTKDLLNYTGEQRDFVYRISEEEWTWSYHRDGPQYSDRSKVDNPFYFENDKKEGIDQKVRHAESKAYNIFDGTSGHVEYTDSKNNKTSTGANTRYQ